MVSNIQTRYLTIKDWPKYHAWPSEQGLRNLIAKRNENGFDKVIIRIGRRILIDEKAFDEWVQELRKK